MFSPVIAEDEVAFSGLFTKKARRETFSCFFLPCVVSSANSQPGKLATGRVGWEQLAVCG